LQQKKEIMSGD